MEIQEGLQETDKGSLAKKPKHGKFPPIHLKNYNIYFIQSFQWMKHCALEGETNGLAINTIYYCKHIMKQGANDKCRICQSQTETVYSTSYQDAKHWQHKSTLSDTPK